MIVYLSGPMTGVEGHNRAVFDAAAAALRAGGVTVVNPAEQPPGHDWEWYMRAALRSLAETDALAQLPDWATSRGARLEAHIATELGISVHTLADLLGET